MYVCICKFVFMFAYMYVSMYVSLYVCMFVCMYEWIFLLVYLLRVEKPEEPISHCWPLRPSLFLFRISFSAFHSQTPTLHSHNCSGLFINSIFSIDIIWEPPWSSGEDVRLQTVRSRVRRDFAQLDPAVCSWERHFDLHFLPGVRHRLRPLARCVKKKCKCICIIYLTIKVIIIIAIIMKFQKIPL